MYVLLLIMILFPVLTHSAAHEKARRILVDISGYFVEFGIDDTTEILHLKTKIMLWNNIPVNEQCIMPYKVYLSGGHQDLDNGEVIKNIKRCYKTEQLIMIKKNKPKKIDLYPPGSLALEQKKKD